MYNEYSFEKVKADFLSILAQLNLDNKQHLKIKEKADRLDYYYDNSKIAELFDNGYVFYIENIAPLINILDIPKYRIKTRIPQRIIEELALVMKKTQKISEVVEVLENSDYVSYVEITDTYEGEQIDNDKKSVTLKITFEDENYKLTQELVDNIKASMLNDLKKRDIVLRS